MSQLRVAGALEREQADLRAVAVGDDEVVVTRDRSECSHRVLDVMGLYFGIRRLTPLEQSVSSQGGHNPHVSPPWSRPSRL